jgi:hypothetical protein
MKDSNFLKENNARHMWHPMAHPADSLANPPEIITGGDGVEITDVDGNRMIDAVGGLWNVNLGYSCAPVKQAIARQLDALPYYSTFRGTSNDAVIELSFMLRDFFAPDGLSRAFFTSGGSDSVEVALRLARQYHKLRGEAGRIKFLSLKKGYHGTHTLGASVNGNANFRTQYEPLMPGCYHIPAPYTYRNPFNETDPAKLAQLCLAALEDEIKFQDPSTIAAFIMEPVLGAGGVIPPHKSFMPRCPRSLHQARNPADRGRGHHRLRPDRKLDRIAALGCEARSDVHRKSHHQRLLPLRRRDDLRCGGGSVRKRQVRQRRDRLGLHLFRPSGRSGRRHRLPERDIAAESQRQRCSTRYATVPGTRGPETKA